MPADLDIVGSAGVDVVPVVPNFHERLKAAVLPAADRVGEDVGRKLGEAISRHITISIPDAVNQGGKNARIAAARQGDNAGGAFARSLRAKLEQAFRAMPKLDVKLGDTGVDAELARIRAKMEQLSNKRIGIDVSAEAARAEVARLEEQLRRLGAAHPNVAVRADTAAARAALRAFREEVDIATANPARIRIETDGSLGARIRAAVQQAEASLPNINIDADTSPAQREIASLRARLTALRDAKVGIDISAEDAIAQVREIQLKLRELSAQRATVDVDTGRARAALTNLGLAIDRMRGRTPTVDVRVDAAAAEAQLAAVHHQVNDLDRDDVRIRVHANTAQAQAALFQLTLALGAVAALPLIPIAAAGIGAIASAAVAAGAGVGALALVAIPAIKGVTSVIQAKTAAEKEAATATDNSAAASVRAAQNALQMASAQQALTAAHRNAARAIEQADRQIESAERGVSDAKQRVRDAERNAVDAAVRAADQRRQSAENVERAERSLADAKRQSLDAEAALTQARKDAADLLDSLDDKLTNGKLDQRDAALRVQEAQEELNRVLADPKATDLQRERAQLAYDEARQAQKEQDKAYRQAQQDAAKARKEGVDGNEEVKKATQDVADAQQNVRDQTEALAQAHKDAAKAEVAAAQQVADAQRQVSDAVRSQADAQRGLADAAQNSAEVQVQAADSIRSAERGVESARLSSIDTTTKAASKTDAYREALAKLTPEQRDLYDSIAGPNGLTKAFKDWSTSLQPDVLPLFTRGVDGAKNSLPGLTPLVKNSADAVKELMDRASAQLKTPFWQGFKKDIAESAKPAIVGLGVAFGNVFKGMAGVVDAFLPHMDGIAAAMDRITGRFANWGKNLKGSPAFEGFLAYVHKMGPKVADAMGKIGRAFFDVAKALEPFTGIILELLGDAAQMISWTAKHAPWAIQAIYGLFIATKLWNLAMSTGPTGQVILVLIGLALAFKYAWDHSETFRNIVTGTWDVISGAVKTAWGSYLKPAFDAISGAFQTIGDVAVSLWQDYIVPVWNGIVEVMKWAIAIILTVLIAPIVIAIEALGLLLGWLWTYCFKPLGAAIAGLSKWLWDKILWPFFKNFWGAIKWVGDKFVDLYTSYIAPAAGWIGDAASGLWKKYLWPFFKAFWDGIKWVGEKFQGLYDDYVDPVVDDIAGAAKWLYDKGLKPAFDRIKEGIGLVGDAFDDAKDAIGKAWGKVSDIVKKPVNFVIDMVYTHGIKAVWDKIAGFVGLPSLPKAPKLLEAGGTVGDGWGIARPMKTNRPTAIVGEGNPRYPEYVIPTDPKYRARALSLHRAAGTQLLESGGVLGGAWDWTKDVWGKGVDWVKTGADLLVHPGKIWSKLVKPTMSHIVDGVGTNPIGKVLTRIPARIVGGLKDKLVSAVTSMFSGGAGGGGGQWVKPVNVPYGTRFGVPGKMWSSGHHTGLDFPAAVGTPIHAVADGEVTGNAGYGPYGNHVIIYHGGNLASLYAHMSKSLTATGKHVNQGDVIGRVGATGNVTGPHLHLEARVNGRPVDPMPYLEGAGFKANAVGAAQEYAKSILGNYGWGPNQFGPLKRLWDGESGWRWNARNMSSGAYGIPQALPASKMASAGPDWLTNYKTQIRWGLDYIKGRPDYGSPAAAYSKWLARSPHWYDEGGYLPPGLSLVANGTGSPEPVFTGSQWSDIRAAKSGGATTIQADVKVFVGDREITDIVRTEITTYDSDVATDLNNGRWI